VYSLLNKLYWTLCKHLESVARFSPQALWPLPSVEATQADELPHGGAGRALAPAVLLLAAVVVVVKRENDDVTPMLHSQRFVNVVFFLFIVLGT
jgi:hypothetical protein